VNISEIRGDEFEGAFGESLSMSSDGSRMVVGMSRNPEKLEGVTRVLDWIPGDSKWLQIGPDVHAQSKNYDFVSLEVSTSLDGTRFMTLGPHSYSATYDVGHARVFDWAANLNEWVQVGSDIDGDYDVGGDCSEDDVDHMYFGGSMALTVDGSRVVVGSATMDSYGQSPDIGHVRVFDWTNNKWQQVGSDIDGESLDEEYFGSSVATSSDGTRIVVVFSQKHNSVQGASNHLRMFESV
jgi:hypothetical protein